MKKLTMLTIETPIFTLECDSKNCLVESSKYSLEAKVVFNSHFELDLGDSDRRINLMITATDVELKAIYEKYIQVQFTMNDQLVAELQTIILDTKIEIQSDLGKNLTLAVDGPNGETFMRHLNES